METVTAALDERDHMIVFNTARGLEMYRRSEVFPAPKVYTESSYDCSRVPAVADDIESLHPPADAAGRREDPTHDPR